MSIIRCTYCDTDTAHPENYYFIRKNYEDNFLLMFFKTPFIYKKNGKTFVGEKSHYLINPPHSQAEHGSYKEGFVNDWIFFKGDLAKKIISRFNLPFNTPFYINEYSIIYPYIKKISTERLLKHTCYEDKISMLVTDMLINLGRQYELSQMNTHPAFLAINNARNFMLDNIEKKITLKDLSKLSNYSESRFCILYNMFYKSSPIEDLLLARIEKAISLLEYSSTSVTETAKLCGFSSVHYFSRKFKEKTGVSPSFYAKNLIK